MWAHPSFGTKALVDFGSFDISGVKLFFVTYPALSHLVFIQKFTNSSLNTTCKTNIYERYIKFNRQQH